MSLGVGLGKKHAISRGFLATTSLLFNPLTPTVDMGTAIKYPVPDRVNPSFVIFDIRAL